MRAETLLERAAMRCPTLEELPPPPAGRTGWPWTVETPSAPEETPQGHEWPRITIVTPSYQHGAFLEQTIRSVLLQGYPDLEYIVVDGGSDDASGEIIRRYAPWLAYWRSNSDSGQVNALNEGLALATGQWRAWLNSDDFYAPGALQRIGSVPDDASWLVGATGYVDETGNRLGRFPLGYRAHSVQGQPEWVDVLCAKNSGTALPQQSTFWSKEAHAAVGELDESLEYVFEHEWWVRLSYAGYRPTLFDEELALYRHHPKQKTRPLTRASAYSEEARVTSKWLDRCPKEHRPVLLAYRRFCLRRARVARARHFAARFALPARR
jgi:glycosyltransferase involved in cell wall biosynthesis